MLPSDMSGNIKNIGRKEKNIEIISKNPKDNILYIYITECNVRKYILNF